MSNMRMFNGEVYGLVDFLMGLNLPPKASRMRMRFCKLCEDKVKELEEEKKEIIKKYCNTDDNGQLKTKQDSEGKKIWDIKDENMPTLEAEANELMSEEWVIDLLEERKEMLEGVKDIVLNLDDYKDYNDNLSFKGEDAMFYDRLCQIFEQVEY